MQNLIKYLKDVRSYVSYVGSTYPAMKRDDLIGQGTGFITEFSQALDMMEKAPPADMERLTNYATGTLKDIAKGQPNGQPGVNPQYQQSVHPQQRLAGQQPVNPQYQQPVNPQQQAEQQIGQALQQAMGGSQPLGNIFGK